MLSARPVLASARWATCYGARKMSDMASAKRTFALRHGVMMWALVVLPTAFHLLFSRLGYSPTDDGFVLAWSRRLLLLEIPHRDFISIRPAGSALLHLPELAFGGYAFWVSRWIVWIEFGVIGWSW